LIVRKCRIARFLYEDKKKEDVGKKPNEIKDDADQSAFSAGISL